MSTTTEAPNGSGSQVERPLSMLAELSYRCPLHCPYCSNPLELGRDRNGQLTAAELTTEEWSRVFRQARALGIVQLGLSGGEPLVRPDLDKLVGVAREEGLYTTLVTAGLSLTRDRAQRLLAAGLDHVQVSIQDADPAASDRLAGTTSFERKLAAARIVRDLGFPLTLNVVLHRHNLDRVGELIALAESLSAQRIELANTQYYGWALANRAALLPTREQLERAEEVVAQARDRIGPRMQILYVLSDYYEEYPKPCMGGWGRRALVVAPSGEVLPCQSATVIPDLTFDTVREHDLEWIWFNSRSFNRFRGTDWMPEPCRSCPVDRQEVDFGGCRCQALQLTGDATATDPVCQFSPDHHLVTEALSEADPDRPLLYRTTR